MGDSVGDYQVVGFKYHIVAAYLVEYRLRDFNEWGFILHNYSRIAVAVGNEGVATPTDAILCE